MRWSGTSASWRCASANASDLWVGYGYIEIAARRRRDSGGHHPSGDRRCEPIPPAAHLASYAGLVPTVHAALTHLGISRTPFLSCKTGGNHQHKYRSFKGLQMFFPELTGADQESNRKEARRNVARPSFGTAAIRLACASARPGTQFGKKTALLCPCSSGIDFDASKALKCSSCLG
jgi:hypothetical protein